MIGILMFSLILVMIILEFRRLWNEGRATIKAFKMIPKEYLLKMRTTKMMKNNDLLDKMEMISF
jgi:hypothetical protein